MCELLLELRLAQVFAVINTEISLSFLITGVIDITARREIKRKWPSRFVSSLQVFPVYRRDSVWGNSWCKSIAHRILIARKLQNPFQADETLTLKFLASSSLYVLNFLGRVSCSVLFLFIARLLRVFMEMKETKRWNIKLQYAASEIAPGLWHTQCFAAVAISLKRVLCL